nr:hypothetical protein [Candidatus Gracilibacteria bacterium]
MNLQICPKCGKENNFWRIYKDINFYKFKGGITIKCGFCKNKEKIWKTKGCSFIRILHGFLWMLPAFILIYLVVVGKINYLIAILLITIYHFLAMYYIIKFGKYK